MTVNNSASRRTSLGLTSGSPKVQPWHLDRLAIVYVRQSTAQQVAENRESGDRQYALAQRAVHLGWPADRVLVIDDDQGKSGATAEGRLGFQRLLAEVGLDHVGLILGLEMSRLARSCKDWHQLLELCGLFRTLLADQDGLYDPTDHNDRLLLGLKSSMRYSTANYTSPSARLTADRPQPRLRAT
jgi:DNA invertase Pin-like site-specific DNA recombinase